MRGRYQAVTLAMWRCIGELAPGALAPVGAPLLAESCDYFGSPQFGVVVDRRIAIWRPVPAADHWVCHIEIDDRTAGPVAVPGVGPVDALINALRVVCLALGEWSGLPHLTPGQERPAPEVDDDWRPPAVQECVVAQDRWLVADDPVPHRVAVGEIVRSPNHPGRKYGMCACYVDIEGVTPGPRARLAIGAIEALRNAAWSAAAYLHGHPDVSVVGAGRIDGPYRAVTDAFWRGVASLHAAEAPAMTAVAATATVPSMRLGRPTSWTLTVGEPVRGGNGRWYCHVDIAGRTSGAVPVPGDGPVDSLINAMRVVDLALNEWFSPAFHGDEPEDHHNDDPHAHRQAPTADRIQAALVEDRWRVAHLGGQRTHRVAIGRPHQNPNDPGSRGTWVCYVEVEGWLQPPHPVRGVGPVDTLRNAAFVAAGFFHLFERVERVTD